MRIQKMRMTRKNEDLIRRQTASRIRNILTLIHDVKYAHLDRCTHPVRRDPAIRFVESRGGLQMSISIIFKFTSCD
jgi:hypothetical protein